MVEKPKFSFEELFRVNGTWHEDDQGLIWVQGSVFVKYPMPELAYKFAHVSGNFLAGYKGLTSLEGLPRRVEGELALGGNKLKNLLDAPDHVGRDLAIESMPDLESLQGFPSHVGGTVHVTYNPQLPMLRCLQANQVKLTKPSFVTTEIFDAMNTCEQILNDDRWRGQGKTGMLNCALELKKAGLEGNAKW